MQTRLWVIVVMAVSVSAAQALSQSLVPRLPSRQEHRNVYEWIYFTPAGVGYVAGDYVLLRTDDGGASWVELLDTYRDNRPPIGELFFVDASTLFLYGAGGFFRSQDGGRNLQRLTLTVPAIDDPKARDTVRSGFFFLDAQRGWGLGDGQFVLTTDGGMTWGQRRIRRPIREPDQPQQLWMFDAQHGIGVGGRQVIRTVDGGENWEAVPNSPRLEKLDCVPAGFCVGMLRRLPSAAFLTNDYGETWQQTQTGLDRETDEEVAFQAIGPGDAVIVGSHIVEQLRVFRNINPRTPLPTFPPGPPPEPNRGFIVRWNGTTWQRREYPEVERFWAIHYVNATEAWASADYNGILHSTDGGQTWTFVPDYYRGLEAQRPKPTPFYKWPPPTFIQVPPGRE